MGCRTVGVEFDEAIYKNAMQNLNAYPRKAEVAFVHAAAENYPVTDADSFFSIILMRNIYPF